MNELWFPSDDKKYVRLFRFLNVLDDAKNVMSPVKFNLWAANLASLGGAIATIVSWIGGHISGIAEMWGPLGGWLTQAHVTHHFDKRERNTQEVRLKETK